MYIYISQCEKTQSKKDMVKKFLAPLHLLQGSICDPLHNTINIWDELLQCMSQGLCLHSLGCCCYSYYESEVLIALISESDPDRNLVCLLWSGVIKEGASSSLISHPGLIPVFVLTDIRAFHLFLFFSSLSHLGEIFSY